ncbi:hypothetical protein OQJ19_13330 [Fluoribacter gormanii]|uniref:Uncharacterized protein n=1 Tax=Fluoribacter gormanii TaxID=464 RepID=A0A377GKB8_9GAMM|nr:hypothetical protein [Fluoribacter gormanii]KTD02584.1 hypothetical protein Lgor_1876 [Fluoribacter gormanii]MCW8471619.1 hypothetical protein [Fluoribacter gormanii]SIR42637.1 hypothetical protein SAMN05421777_1123 [Fluoribacter gormanii]STO25269.1 Uncharacterised protein [Fluoribacter gormanii]
MKNANLASRWVNRCITILFLLGSPLVGAYAACCSGHGGVASCNTTTGFQMCKDGTASPTCKCKKAKSTTATTTTTKSHTTTKTTPATTTTTTTKSKSWWGGKSTTTQPATSTTKTTTTTTTSSKGCCSKHGGVAQCDASTGHLKCKDGTQSPSCACH